MSVHLVKLAAGISDFGLLKKRLEERAVCDEILGETVPVFTRNSPKRKDALLAGGSLYWVAGGYIVGRTDIQDIREEYDEEGRKYCLLFISAALKRVQAAPKRAFQGWRYLQGSDVPEDVEEEVGDYADAPAEMLNELQKLGLL